MNIAIFGAGYVGCVSAACLARFGNKIWLVEVATNKLELLLEGKSPVVEAGLDQELKRYVTSGSVIPTASATDAVVNSELAMVCVGTPSLPDRRPDLGQVRKVLRDISTALSQRPGSYVIALRSTVPYPQIESELLPEFIHDCQGRFGTEITFALNPEFQREGSAIKDFLEPPFVVVGTQHEAPAAVLKKLYQPIAAPFWVVSPGSASLLKYACNAFHATKIVFANEIASLGPTFKADPDIVMDIFCQDHVLNISQAYLRPGYAYGGSCLPKDLRALNQSATSSGITCPLFFSLPESNSMLIEHAVKAIQQLGVRRISLMGLSFKGGTDDLRESPLVELAERLLGKGYKLKIFDPDVDLNKLQGRNLEYVEQHLQHLALLICPDIKDALKEVELAIIGKRIFSTVQLQDISPDGLLVLDLTRQIPKSSASLHLLYLDGMGAHKLR
jgi:GDP-mannose 6-dehydrogenase